MILQHGCGRSKRAHNLAMCLQASAHWKYVSNHVNARMQVLKCTNEPCCSEGNFGCECALLERALRVPQVFASI